MANEISCIKFDDSWANPDFETHNFRVVSPAYLLKHHLNENEYKSIFDPHDAYDKVRPLMEHKRGAKIPFRHTIREAILLCKDGTRIDDLQEAVKHVEDTLGFKCCSIAIHHDEGHIDKATGETVYNTHAHLVFFTLDEQGRQMSRLTKMKRKLSDLQQELADILDMKHPKIGAEVIALDHKAYRQEQQRLEKAQEIARAEIRKEYTDEIVKTILVNEKLQKDLKENYISKKDVKAEIEKARKEWIKEQGHTADEYKELRKLSQEQYKSIEELQKQINELTERFKAEKAKAPSMEEIIKNPQVNEMAKTLKEVAEVLEVPKNERGRVEFKKIIETAKEVKEENRSMKRLLTQATLAINLKLKTAYNSFKDAVNHLLSWQHPEPERQPEPDQTQHLKNTLASFRNEISDLYRSQTNPDQPDRPDRQQPEQSKRPKKSRGFGR